jgi:hypothetical protein
MKQRSFAGRPIAIGVALLLGALGVMQPAFAQSTCAATENFVADADVTRVAEAYALDAIDAARESFGVSLDWSDESVGSVEQILGVLHESRAEAPSEDVVWTFAKAFGSYVGEVYRRNHGGEWGLVTMEGNQFPGVQTSACVLFWPWAKAHGRIMNGPEDNVLHYYEALLRQ